MEAEKELLRYTTLYDNERFEQVVDSLLDGDLEDKAKAAKSIHNFLFAPELLRQKAGEKSVQNLSIQNFTLKGDIPELNTNIQKIFNQTQNYDDRWRYAYNEVQFDPGRDYIEVLDVNNGIAFDRLAEGNKVSIYKLTGAVGIVRAITLAAGVGWTFEMLEDRKYNLMTQIAERFRDAYFHRMARIHYSLLVEAGFNTSNANGGTAVPYAGSGTDPEAQRIVRTIDDAANMIGNAIQNLGLVPDPAMSPVIVYTYPQHYHRILNAIKPVSGFLTSQYPTLARDVQVYPTYHLIRTNGTALSTNEALLVIPGGKNITATKLPPTEYTRTDIESFSQIMTVRTRIAVSVSEPKQVLRITLV